MRTFTAWQPLERPGFESPLDTFRTFNTKHGLTPDTVRNCFDPEETLDYCLMELAEADAMDVAAKVATADEWLCRVCGGTSRTCECES